MSESAGRTIVRWCCGTFRAHFQEAGKPGVAIFPYRDANGRVRWIMQHRAEEVEAPDGTVPQLWAVFEQPVGFCPFCGKNLMRWYEDAEPLLRSELSIGARAGTEDLPPRPPPSA